MKEYILLNPEKVEEQKKRARLRGSALCVALQKECGLNINPQVFALSHIVTANERGGTNIDYVRAFCKAVGCSIDDIKIASENDATENAIEIGFGPAPVWHKVADGLPPIVATTYSGFSYSNSVWMRRGNRVGVVKVCQSERYGNNWRVDLTQESHLKANTYAVRYFPIEDGDEWAEVL